MDPVCRDPLLEASEPFGHRPIFEETPPSAMHHEATLAWTFVAALTALIGYEVFATYL